MEQRVCPKCKEFWPPSPSLTFRFCPRCGVRLEQPCPSCSQDLPTLSPECPRCQIRLQICPSCFRLFPLREKLCPSCRQPLKALRPSYACLRGNAANTFTASPAFPDLLPQQTPSPWEQNFSPFVYGRFSLWEFAFCQWFGKVEVALLAPSPPRL